MEVLQGTLGQGRVPLGEHFQVVDGLAMPYRFKMFPKALAAYGDAVLQHSLGFAHGERVSLDGIGVVSEADTHVLPYLGDDIRGQRTVGIEARLERIHGGKQFGCVFHGISPAGLRIVRRGEEAREGFCGRTRKILLKGSRSGVQIAIWTPKKV